MKTLSRAFFASITCCTAFSPLVHYHSENALNCFQLQFISGLLLLLPLPLPLTESQFTINFHFFPQQLFYSARCSIIDLSAMKRQRRLARNTLEMAK
jgi:hypothetical protein